MEYKDKFPITNPASYMRIGTSYYKKLLKPCGLDNFEATLAPWSIETIKQDLTKDQLGRIEKFEGFCNIPSHINYQAKVGKFYNQYHPLDFEPKFGEWKNIEYFLRHIFTDQYELGLDYLTLLYTSPTQKLPVLCLVSKQRGTGKSTFLFLLKKMFGKNATYITNETFNSNFNNDWAASLLGFIDEAFFEKREISEKIKNLSTAKTTKIEGKGKDRYEIDFHCKFILASNNEDNFLFIENVEIRYWVKKILPFKQENTFLLETMIPEIPAFFYYLLNRPLTVPKALSRMWFSYDQIKTNELLRVMKSTRSQEEIELLFILKELFDITEIAECNLSNTDAVNLIQQVNKKVNVTRSKITYLFKEEWKLGEPCSPSNYTTYIYNNLGNFIQINKKNRYYTISRLAIFKKFEDNNFE
jgi:hypothetical protein